MSLSSLGAINAVTGLIAKKSAEVAAASGAVIAGAGILIGAHGLDVWHHAHAIQSDNMSAQQTIVQQRIHLRNMEDRLQHLSRTMPHACMEHQALYSDVQKGAACIGNTPHAYTSLTQNVRALRMDIPQWAAQNGLSIQNIIAANNGLMNGPATGSATHGSPVPGFPGIAQSTFKVQGTYTTLGGLRSFVHHMPTGIELTGVHIQKNQFTAEITAYGLTA